MISRRKIVVFGMSLYPPVFSRNRMVALTTVRFGVHFSFAPSSSCPVLTSFLVPHPAKR
jgi:hypothetical protein